MASTRDEAQYGRTPQVVYAINDTDISVFVVQLIGMNQYFILLPCLKDVLDSPTELTRADVPFTEGSLAANLFYYLTVAQKQQFDRL